MLNFAHKIERVIEKYTLISFIATIAIMIINCIDVFTTKVFIRPLTGTYEITQLLMLCAVIGSYAYGQTTKKHINMGIIIKNLPRAVRFLISGILGVASTIIAVVIGVAAVQQMGVAMANNTVTGTLFIPWWPFYLIEGICMFVFAFVLCYDTLLTFVAIGGNKDIMEYVESKWS